jgi:hypothetical protein
MSARAITDSVRHGDRLLARGALFLLLALYTATFVGLPDNPDAEVEFQTTSALARGQTLALHGTPEAKEIVRARFSVEEGGGDRAGRFYSWFGVGQALVALPFYYGGTWLAIAFPEYEDRHGQRMSYGAGRSEYFEHLVVGWRNPLLGALTAWLVALSARRLGAGRRTSFVAALAYGVTTYAWPQARSTLSDVQATFFVMLVVHQLLRLREAVELQRKLGAGDLLLLGAAAGGAFLTRVITAPSLAVLALATLYVICGRGRRSRARGQPTSGLQRLRALFLLGLPAVAAIAFFLAVNDLRFGDPFTTGYERAVASGDWFSFAPHEGLLGVTVAPGKGLLWMAPLLLIAPIGLRALRRRGDRLVFWTTLGVALAVATPIVMAQAFHGGPTYGPRYLLPMLPVLWLSVAVALEEALHRPHLLKVSVGLGVLGLVVATAGALVDTSTHHDLSIQVARHEYPLPVDEMGLAPDDPVRGDPAKLEELREGMRWVNIQFDARYAAPWWHWRLLRHRVASPQPPAEERFDAAELFYYGGLPPLSATHMRDRGFLHLGWVDFVDELGGPSWVPVLVVGLLLLLGALCTVLGLDRTLT